MNVCLKCLCCYASTHITSHVSHEIGRCESTVNVCLCVYVKYLAVSDQQLIAAVFVQAEVVRQCGRWWLVWQLLWHQRCLLHLCQSDLSHKYTDTSYAASTGCKWQMVHGNLCYNMFVKIMAFNIYFSFFPSCLINCNILDFKNCKIIKTPTLQNIWKVRLFFLSKSFWDEYTSV